MKRFGSHVELAILIDELDNENTQDFYRVQHFLLGCCSHLRHYIEWPKIKDIYVKAKLGLGSKSLFMKSPDWRDFSKFAGMPGGRRSPQFVVYQALADLIEYQDLRHMQYAITGNLRRLSRFILPDQMSAIWDDTAVQVPEYQKKYPLSIRRMGDEIRKAEKYSELGVLGDLCEDQNLIEEANHFHDPKQLHTYGCRWLFNICKGMDGR